MTNQEESCLSMFLTFSIFNEGQTEITNLIPNYAANYAIFQGTIPKIQAFSLMQKTSKKGVTVGKNLLKKTLIVTTADYFRKLTAFALFTNNISLSQEVKIPERKLRQVADTAVRDFAKLAYDKGQAYLPSLDSYGITAVTQTSFLNKITAYNATLGKPGVSKNESGMTTMKLKALFKTAKAALKRMDTAVEVVRLTQPNFYVAYHKNRKVTYTGIGTLAVKALVTDAATGTPLRGATVTFTREGDKAIAKALNEKPDMVKKTAVKGGFKIKTMPAGTYTVIVKKDGFADQVTTAVISEGEMSDIKVKLTRN